MSHDDKTKDSATITADAIDAAVGANTGSSQSETTPRSRASEERRRRRREFEPTRADIHHHLSLIHI